MISYEYISLCIKAGWVRAFLEWLVEDLKDQLTEKFKHRFGHGASKDMLNKGTDLAHG